MEEISREPDGESLEEKRVGVETWDFGGIWYGTIDMGYSYVPCNKSKPELSKSVDEP